ncbi:MAG: AAA-like domain-containing protein [Crocosphaera sp.]
MNSSNGFQVGGAIPPSSILYVTRKADEEFYENLKNGKFCYVLNSRQMGKSSLRVRTIERLRNEQIVCIDIDITPLCGLNVSPKEFYGGFLEILVKNLISQLSNRNSSESSLGIWWKNYDHISPYQRFQKYIEDEILDKTTKEIIIFIDEIDRILDLEFRDDFFAFIRWCYNQRASNPKYNNLTFALLGVATPSDLIADNKRTPFNQESIGIELSGFQLGETKPLQDQLSKTVSNSNSHKILEEVLKWTNGQPFLTQLVCQFVTAYDSPIVHNSESLFVYNLINEKITENWIEKDYQDHFNTIYSRLVTNNNHSSEILEVYQKILEKDEIVYEKDADSHIQLLLSGLVFKQGGKLKVFNPIYKRVFNQNWLLKELSKLKEVTSIVEINHSLTESEIIEKLNNLSQPNFSHVCLDIISGLGFSQAQEYLAQGLEMSFTDKLIRKSSDEMFRTEETWLIVLGRYQNSASENNRIQTYVTLALKEAQKAKVDNLLTIFFAEISSDIIAEYHNTAKRAKLNSVIISGIFSADLVNDYSPQTLGRIKNPCFSFRQLRQRMKQQAEDATWRTQFQSLTALPTRVKPGKSDSIMDEADIIRARFKTHCFLLLGDPGSGKTTSIQALAEELANKGATTPVLMFLNQYSGNLLADLGKVLQEETNPLSEENTLSLLASGSLTVMLDGLNEVYEPELQTKLVAEINQYTNPENSATRSQWIISGRKYDYSMARQHSLQYLENHIWELQPLTADLIYDFLSKGLGEEKGKEVYHNLGATIREICGNPLLLNMVLTVCSETDKIPKGRGALYHQFVNLLLDWGKDRDNTQDSLRSLSKAFNSNLTHESYCNLARTVLMKMAQEMITTAIPWRELQSSIVEALSDNYTLGENAPKFLIDNLIRQGVLKRRGSVLTFRHHTFQEYFEALGMSNQPIDSLIPQGGVQGHKREVVVFLSGIIDNPNKLVERALKSDDQLAYDLIREASNEVDEQLIHQVGNKIWNQIVRGGSWTGEKRAIALKFKALAARLGKTDEELAREIIQPSNETSFYDNLLSYYQELGDTSSQQAIFDDLGINEVEEIPDDLLFRAALLAYEKGDYNHVIKLYTKYLQAHPDSSPAYGNRALAYKALGKKEEALADHRKALGLDPKGSNNRTNLALLLLNMGQQEEAIEQLQTAIENQPNYPQAYYKLGCVFTSEQPEEALPLLEQAVRLAAPQNITPYTKKLAEVQEINADFIGVIRSLKQLIELNPTSYLVKQWKQKIAEMRLKFDAVEKRRSVKEKLEGQRDVNLFDLAKEFFEIIGFDCQYYDSSWLHCTTNKQEFPSQIIAYVLDVPTLTGTLIRDVMESITDESKSNSTIIIFTPAEILESDARTQLFAYQQSQKNISLVTSLDAEEAILTGKGYQTLQAIIRRTSTGEDSFRYSRIVSNRMDFFGRNQEIREYISLIENNQPFGLYGIHKIGKSSLLRKLEQNIKAYLRHITTVWVEMDSRIKNPSQLYYRILKKLPYEIDLPKDENSISANYFENILRQFQLRQQQKYIGHRVLLILDEYGFLIPDREGRGGIQDYLDVLGMFKTLCQEGNWFSLLPCGRTTALSRVGSWPEGENPFIGILQEKLLKPFTFQEVEEMVRALGAKHGLNFSDKALHKIFEITGGHPLFTRILGSYIQTYHQQGDVTPELVETATDAYLNNNQDKALLLTIYENRLDRKEQYIVELLAVINKPLSYEQLVPKDVSSQESRLLREAVKNLIDTSVIQKNGSEKIIHQYELLRRLIDQQITHNQRKEIEQKLSSLQVQQEKIKPIIQEEKIKPIIQEEKIKPIIKEEKIKPITETTTRNRLRRERRTNSVFPQFSSIILVLISFLLGGLIFLFLGPIIFNPTDSNTEPESTVSPNSE